jgi:translation elongation factor EF-G
MTQGQGTFTMEFSRYKRLPPGLERELIETRKKSPVGGIA